LKCIGSIYSLGLPGKFVQFSAYNLDLFHVIQMVAFQFGSLLVSQRTTVTNSVIGRSISLKGVPKQVWFIMMIISLKQSKIQQLVYRLIYTVQYMKYCLSNYSLCFTILQIWIIKRWHKVPTLIIYLMYMYWQVAPQLSEVVRVGDITEPSSDSAGSLI